MCDCFFVQRNDEVGAYLSVCKKIAMKLYCFFWGHKKSEENDSGFAICPRCNMHEYYDNPLCCSDAKWPYFYSDGVLLRPIFYLRRRVLAACLNYRNRNRLVGCTYCFQQSKAKQWKYNICPKCGEEELPF